MLQYSTSVEKLDDINFDIAGHCIISEVVTNCEYSQKTAHVFYSFQEKGKYINNAANFLIDGIKKGHKSLIIEKPEIFEEIISKIASRGYKKNEIESIVFMEDKTYYLCNNQFDVETCLKNLEGKLKKDIEEGVFVRIWGRVLFQLNDPVVSKLRLYECECDKFVNDTKAIIVCTYNGLTVPSYIQNEMLKTHPYFMTDDQIKLSPFYEKENLNIPSREELKRLQNLDNELILLQKENRKLQNINNKIKMKKAVIEESEKFYRNLINEFPISIVITKNDQIVYINQTGVMKFTSNNLHGKSFSQLFEKTSISTTNGLCEYKFCFEIGEANYFDVKSIPIWFEGENAVLHVLIDLTEQKLNEKLMVRSEKLSMAGELAAGIAHEVRNPLTAIKGFIKLLENTSNDYYLSIINGEIARIEQISSELLMLAKPHSDTFKQTDILVLLRNVIALLGTQAIIKNIEIELVTNENEIYINCEETKIRQVFINIIKNAIEAMEKGMISVHVKQVSEKVQIDIVDEGDGMTQEMLDKIGEPFYTTKEKGTGLGLMVCYKIVGNHNGEIKVTSQKGVGTTFSVIVPLA